VTAASESQSAESLPALGHASQFDVIACLTILKAEQQVIHSADIVKLPDARRLPSLVSDPAALARNALRRHAARLTEFGPYLAQEGIWNMLLELLIARREGRLVAIKCLWLASGVPQSTALRWVHLLVAQGHVTRRGDPRDGRRCSLELSEELALRVDRFLAATEGRRS
jgi:hypothetical protein